MVRPSGIQAGWEWWSKSPLEIWRGAPPSTGTTNNWLLPGWMRPAPSLRQRSRVTTIGAAAQVAPSGFSGIFTRHAGGAGTRAVYAIEWPSGDHAGLAAEFSPAVISASWPLSSQWTRIWVLPPFRL